MIDYQKHRENLTETLGRKNPTLTGRFQYLLSLDAEELLDKAEKWDKVNEGLAVEGVHTSKGLLGELYELREKRETLENIIEKIHAMASKESPSLYQKIIDISANAIEDPTPNTEAPY